MMAMLSAVSCVNGNSDNNAATTDTIDSTAIAPNDSDSVISVTGTALDGAMNSIFIKAANGDTLNFAYPDLDESKRDSWVEGDTVTAVLFGLVDVVVVKLHEVVVLHLRKQVGNGGHFCGHSIAARDDELKVAAAGFDGG